MVEAMKPGSVSVDLAVESGGNCALSQPGKVVDHNGVKIVGHLNVPSRLAADASALYARNIYNFIELLVDKGSKQLAVNWEDKIVADTCIIRDGKIRSEEHTSELQSLMRTSSAVFCLKKKKNNTTNK